VEISLEGAAFSDHLPILINMAGSKVMCRRGRGFRYEATWGEKKECKEIIKKIWKVKDTACGTWNLGRYHSKTKFFYFFISLYSYQTFLLFFFFQRQLRCLGKKL
jgi:hypothetical protein